MSPFGDSQRLGRVARLAAAVAAVLLVGVVGVRLYQGSQTPEMIVADLVEPLRGKVDAGDLYGWKTYRGPGDVSEFSKVSFVLGGSLVDLRVSMESGDRAKAQQLLDQLSTLMYELSRPDTERATAYTRIAEQIKNGADPRTLVDEVEALEGPFGEGGIYLTDEFDPSFLAFGKWAEAGRLSAVARSPAFFEDRDTWRFLDRLREDEAARLEPVAEQLDLVESTARGEDLGAAEYESLEKAFGTIIERYDI